MFQISEMVAADYDEVLRLWQQSQGVGLNESDTRDCIAAYLERNLGLSSSPGTMVALSEPCFVGMMVGVATCIIWASLCRPLVCVEGQPNLAAELLLRMLKSQGFQLRYHGDFDWGGVRIATHLWHVFAFEPWRFRDSDYRSAPPGRRLTGKPTATPSDAELRRSMEELKAAVHEEAVVIDLVSAWRTLDSSSTRELERRE